MAIEFEVDLPADWPRHEIAMVLEAARELFTCATFHYLYTDRTGLAFVATTDTAADAQDIESAVRAYLAIAFQQ